MTQTSAPSPVVDDAHLLAAFIDRKDQKAFRLLVDRYHRMVYTVCYRGLNRNASAADDAAQAVFLLLVRKAHRISPPALSGWLFRTCLRVTYTMRREEQRRKKRETVMAKPTNAHAVPSSPDKLDLLQRDELIHEAISHLPPKQRDALLLYYFAGCDQATIGSRLGCSPKAVQKRIEYAIAALRAKLSRHQWTNLMSVGVMGLEPLRTLQLPADLAARCASMSTTHVAAVPAQIADQVMRSLWIKTTVVAASPFVAAAVATIIYLQSAPPTAPTIPSVVAEPVPVVAVTPPAAAGVSERAMQAAPPTPWRTATRKLQTPTDEPAATQSYVETFTHLAGSGENVDPEKPQTDDPTALPNPMPPMPNQRVVNVHWNVGAASSPPPPSATMPAPLKPGTP